MSHTMPAAVAWLGLAGVILGLAGALAYFLFPDSERPKYAVAVGFGIVFLSDVADHLSGTLF
ncbi:hypothetical protein DMJ13_27430 [halophilic archaeon]|nr:hypothetical protein DMJ13_27430 [halophilic archaeon]